MTTPRNWYGLLAAALWAMTGGALPAADGPAYLSHPPPRPLPQASRRPMADGPALYVDAAGGSDDGPGTESQPWRTLGHAATRLKPGDTLYLRGGVYYERPTLRLTGTPGNPITIRACPSELVIIDGGLREFLDDPAGSWEPAPDGVPGEFRSAKTYPGLADFTEPGVNAMGLFGDSMLPLHGYRSFADLRASNEYWLIESKMEAEGGIYCGPGVKYDAATQRIHIRLGHTHLNVLGVNNYRGVEDPRRVPLVIAGHSAGPALRIQGSRHLRLQDVVVRGSVTSTISVADCSDVTLEGLTAYGGYSPIVITDTRRLRCFDSAFRGHAGPWTSRAHLKYRSVESRIFSASHWHPSENYDFEIGWCEFTDSVDGVFLGNVGGVLFHHNLVENVTDDGMFMTATTAYDNVTPGGNMVIFQNCFSRILTTFAFGVGHGRQRATSEGTQTGGGLWICRNVFDFRAPVYKGPPGSAESDTQLDQPARFASDHGGPAWEPMRIYHNTIVTANGLYLDNLTTHMNHTRRWLYNNACFYMGDLVGIPEPSAWQGLYTNGNLHWSASQGEGGGDILRTAVAKMGPRAQEAIRQAASRPASVKIAPPARPAPQKFQGLAADDALALAEPPDLRDMDREVAAAKAAPVPIPVPPLDQWATHDV